MKYQGKDYKMALNLDAVCQLEAEGMKLQEVLNGALDMRKTVTLARILLNAAQDEDVFTDAMLRKHFNPAALTGIYAEIKGALIDGMKIESRDDSKPRDLYLEEIEAKKAEA